MRARVLVIGVMMLLGVAAATAAETPPQGPQPPGIDESALPEEPEECRAACATADTECQAWIKKTIEDCKKRVMEPCDFWCPCTQYIGAAFFACAQECDTCRWEALPIAEACGDKRGEYEATCAAQRKRCEGLCE